MSACRSGGGAAAAGPARTGLRPASTPRLRPLVTRVSRGCTALVLLVVVAACSDASGCGDFRITSTPLGVGSTQEVEVEVVGGTVPSVDVNGGIYLQAEGSPRLTVGDGQHRATVERRRDGLRMTVGQQTLRLDGPIGCD